MIAAIEADAVALLDPATGAVRRRIPLGAEARRWWSWSSRLLRAGSELLVAQGGGYQEVAVLDFAGRARWSFRPDPDLPPIGLLPADLDGDGRPESYSASLGTVYRLDADGRVVWRQTLTGLVNSLDVAGPSDGRPSLVAAVTSARRIHLFSAGGDPVTTLPLAERAAYRFTLVDWPCARALAGGVERVVVLDLAGRRLLEHPLGDFRFSEARAARLDDGAGAHLAVLAAGPRDTARWRLLPGRRARLRRDPGQRGPAPGCPRPRRPRRRPPAGRRRPLALPPLAVPGEARAGAEASSEPMIYRARYCWRIASLSRNSRAVPSKRMCPFSRT